MAALAAVFSPISWPQEGSFKAPRMLLGVRFLNQAALKYLLYCIREHSPGKRIRRVTITTQQPMTNDSQPLELSSDGWELHWGPRGFLNVHSSHLGWDHGISGSCSAMWQTLHVYGLVGCPCLATNKSLEGQRVCGREGCHHRNIHPLHKFSKSFLCACWISEHSSLLPPVHTQNFSGLKFTSPKLSLIESNMLWWLLFLILKFWLITFFGGTFYFLCIG